MKRSIVVLVTACFLAFPTSVYAEPLDEVSVIDGNVNGIVIADDTVGFIEDDNDAPDLTETQEILSTSGDTALDSQHAIEGDHENVTDQIYDGNPAGYPVDDYGEGSSEPTDNAGNSDSVDPSNLYDPSDSEVPSDTDEPSDPAPAGWQEADGARFYVDPETGERLAGGVFEIEGESYCFGPDGALATGWMAIDGDVYYFDPESGAMLSGCEAVIRGLCAPISASGGASFSDVSGSTPHAGDILWTYESGVSTGWVSPDGARTFRPMDRIVRQDMAAFLYRLAGSPAFVPAEGDARFFADVDPDTPHAAEVWWLASAGISTGWVEADGTRTFRPAAPVVRQDMAAFLYRLAGSPGYEPDMAARSFFADVDGGTPHAAEVWWLASAGVSEGWAAAGGAREFRPASPIVRADMAAFLRRTYSLEGYEPEGEHAYLFAGDGALVTGWAPDGSFRSPSNGALVEAGWVSDGAGLGYIDPGTGELLRDGLHEIAGYSYLFDGEGLVQHGWAEVGGARRCFSPASGFMYAGGIFGVGGSRYCFDDDGSLRTGLVDVGGHTYYFDPSTSEMRTGLVDVGGRLCYFDRTTGRMFGQNLYSASAQQQRVASLAWNEPTTPSGWCALWVHNVFEAYGIYDVDGNACDLYNNYCTSSNPSDLKVGMIVAVSRHPGTSGGRIYGHIGIYVGDGIMLDSSGSVRVWNVQDWINSYNGWVTPKWGWYGNRKLG